MNLILNFGFLLIIWPNLSRSQDNNKGIISINSPRDPSQNDQQESKHVLVKLPDDLEAVLNLQKSDRSRIHASILGLNPDEDQHLDSILGPGDIFTTTAKPDTTSSLRTTVRRPPETTTPNSRTTQPFNPVIKVEDTSVDRSIWSIAWEAHIYFSGTLFVLLAIYCFVNILRLHTFSRLFSRGYFVALNLCLIVIGVLRPIYLFHDPYNGDQTFSRIVAYLLLDTGLPCISTAFAILFLALLRATQIELISPEFQTPKSLGIFCFLHFAISIGVDIAIGLVIEVRYLILLCQGFFIVWSLLLSAGYFYIFSAMKKVAMRSREDLMRQMCPKLAMDVNSYGHQRQYQTSDSFPAISRPPLARAVHLTLGVAILGSLTGGVQLFGMIKMLGLQKDDMSSRHNEVAWFGYQVSMRILEVTICTLLAVIATTPLRSNISPNSPQRRKKNAKEFLKSLFCCCCYRDSIPPIEFEDEIYSEICSTNRSVRQMQLQAQNGTAYQLQQHSGDVNNPYGTLAGRMTLQQPQVIQMGTIHDPGNMGVHSNNGMLLIAPDGGTGDPLNSIASSSSNPNSTLRSGQIQDTNRTSVASSRATLDTALYSNMRSRPSSMLFNDSGFVRFRSNGDPNLNQDDVLKQSTGDLTAEFGINHQQILLHSKNAIPVKAKEGLLRASQSFDDSVLLMDQNNHERRSPDEKISPASQPEQSLCDRNSSPIYKSIEESQPIYEPPPGMILPSAGVTKNFNPYSESDMESTQQIYNRPPSRCSSVSATQSFDMRMYGRTKPGGTGGGTTQTLNRNETGQGKEKLENPFYYYGSTRKQRHQVPQKPRPLLPSQRAQLEAQTRGNNHNSASNNSRPNSRQALLASSSQDSDQFIRSRSLGGYYKRGDEEEVPPPPPPPVRNQLMRGHHMAAAGSMTPLSYSRWQHAQSQEAGGIKRYNPLYDTPPTARHARNMMVNPTRAQLRLDQSGPGNNFRLMESPKNFSNQQVHNARFIPSEIRGMMMPQPRPRQLRNEPPQLVRGSNNNDHILSPVFTDHSVASSQQGYDGEDDDDDSDVLSNNYEEDGLADNESELSGAVGGKRSKPVNLPKKALSPLEYSALLKLQSQQQDNVNHGQQLSRSSSSSSGSVSWTHGVGANEKTKNDYRRVSTEEEKMKRITAAKESNKVNNTLFSTTSGEDSSDYEGEPAHVSKVGLKLDKQHKQDLDKNLFRWDGSKID